MPHGSLHLALLAILLCAGPLSAAPNRPIDNMESPTLYTPAQPELGHKWSGKVALETGDQREGAGCLRFDVTSARSNEESYPQWGRSFDPAQNDWTGFRALRYQVKVVSKDPNVAQKQMCIVVYNGDSPFQQFQTHTVPVGQWVQLTDSIVSYHRERVRGIVIYLYETDPSTKDDYSWWVDDLELVPSEPGQTEFDGEMVVPARGPARGSLLRLAAPRGPGLAFDSGGRIERLSLGGRPLHDGGGQVEALSGVLLFDHRADPGPRPVGGTLTRSDGGLTQSAALGNGLRVTARYRADGERLDGHIYVRDTRPADRPLTLYFALPLDALGWTWWDDIRTPKVIQGTGDFGAPLRLPAGLRYSPYPYACVGNEQAALCLAVPLHQPRVQRFVYDPRCKLLYVAWDFCLTPAAAKQNQTADFAFSILAADPRWGFRAATAAYYAACPGDFVKRVKQEGGWGCWGTYEHNPNLADLGFQFHWGPDSRGAKDAAEPVRFDNEHGIYSLPYIEWTNLHVSMEGYENATGKDILARLQWLADPNRTESARKLSYLFPYDERLGPDLDGWMRRVARAWLNSALLDSSGNPYGRADKAEFSIYAAKYIPINADPDIPGGAGDLFLHQFRPAIEKWYTDQGLHIDGFGWDNFYVSGSALDVRREHFAAADQPLLFDALSLQPGILKDMGTYELQRVVVDQLRKQGRYLIANQGNISPVHATLPLLDVFGYEWNIENVGTYARTLAHHKPVCTLPCAAAHYLEPFVREHLLYGLWPGGYYTTDSPDYLALMRRVVPLVRRECASGWEPVTFARADRPEVQVERFGGEEKPLLFSLRNGGKENVTATVSVDAAAFGRHPARLPRAMAVTELYAGQPVKVVAGPPLSFSLELAAGQVYLVAVEPGGDAR